MKASIASVLPAALLVPAQDTFNNPIIWSLGTDGLTLSTATVTTNLYAARNTLTHRVVGSRSSGTFRINVRDLTVEDIAGVAILRDDSAYIGARKEADGNVTLVHKASRVFASWEQDLWLRITADVTPTFIPAEDGLNTAQLEYSTDGDTFRQLGPDFQIHNLWELFLSFRVAVFNFATEVLGGSLHIKGFDLQLME